MRPRASRTEDGLLWTGCPWRRTSTTCGVTRKTSLSAVGEAVQLPRQRVRVEGQGVQVGFGLQQIRRPGAAGQGPYGLAAFAQRADESAGDLLDSRADRAGRHQNKITT
ncbi:hypothetical protein GCM10010304_64910 [Streptomyces roseoviolaceus]